jgi:transcriptional regulator GlxA family with amidase domain
LSSRQLRRIVQQKLGVPPIQLILTRRLLLAKQLLTETKLPMIEIAFASGFASLRRFNDAFITRYRMAPTRLRKKPLMARIFPAIWKRQFCNWRIVRLMTGKASWLF